MKKNDVSMDEDPLSKLLGSRQALDRQLLAGLLEPFVIIDEDTGTVAPLPAFSRLNERQKVLATMLGIKVAGALGKRDHEQIGSKELSDMTGINYNSVRSYLSQLEKKKMIAKGETGYFVPSYNLPRMKGELNVNGKKLE